jgi:transcriptional regulator with XRE-family HTH domain
MTLGERIKYFRKEAGFTQSELASRANLHPVSIRKYETDKMKPQLAQIEKIADALNISSNIIIGLEYSNLKLKTVGDFMAIFCMLLNTEKLLIEGERGEDGFIKSETLCIRVKDNSITEEILNFEKINHLLRQAVAGKEDALNSNSYNAILAQLLEAKEKVTYQAQRSMTLLGESEKLVINSR